MTNPHKKRHKERLILFFLSLGLLLFTLSNLTPTLRTNFVGISHIFTWKAAPRDYLIEQLEMEQARLKAELALASLAQPKLTSQLARVIRRDPLCPHVLWIDAGTDNCPFIEQFSPICIGPHAIGLVEEVGAVRSKIRLVSDPKVHLHVCAALGGNVSQYYIDELNALSQDPVVQSALELVAKKIGNCYEEKLATAQLKGFDKKSRFTGEVIQGCFKVGDQLVTSGYDGIFPAGLFIGRITKVSQSSEKIEAKPGYPYHSLRAVFVLPAGAGV